MKVKKNLSLEDNVLKSAESKAKDMGFNFSAYITYLINNDIVDLAEKIDIVETKSNIKNDKVSSAIDNILG